MKSIAEAWLTERASRIPWARLLAETVAIVFSILLAFGINAWWEDRGSRLAEQDILTSLSEEFAANQDSLAITLAYFDAWRDASARWLESTPLELESVSEDAAAAMLSHLLGAKSFHPATGVHEFVLASGQFSLLSNQDLREALGEMSGLYAEAEEELARDFNLRDELVPLLPTGTLLAFSGQGSRGPSVAPHPSEVLRQMREDVSLVERFVWKDMIRQHYIAELMIVAAQQERILKLISDSQR